MKYEFRSNKIFVAGDNAKDPSDFEEYCSKFETVEKQVNLLNGDETLLVKLYLPYKEKIFKIDRDELREIKIFNALTKQGLTVIEGENDGPLLKTILTDTEKNAPVVFKHDVLGFRTVNDKTCFLGYNPIGDFSDLELHSTYKNNSLAPGGSFGAWRKFIMKSVAKKPLLCLITALGVTASVVFFLKEEGIFTDTLLFALIGDSSIGKSTLLEYLAANTAASKKYVHNFSATTNAIPALLRQHPGMITVLDEATYTPSIDWDSLLYTIPDGKEKLKCNAAGELRENEEFSGSVIIASETSVLERTVQNPGQMARIVEFEE